MNGIISRRRRICIIWTTAVTFVVVLLGVVSQSWKTTTALAPPQEQNRHRQAQDEQNQWNQNDDYQDDYNDDSATDCPKDNIRYCNNPSRIMFDQDVYCDPDTCRWDTDRLSPYRKPSPCRSIAITNVSELDDFLEPCLWWEMLYGYLTPTAAPSVTPSPTITPNPTLTPYPTSVPVPTPVPYPTSAPVSFWTGNMTEEGYNTFYNSSSNSPSAVPQDTTTATPTVAANTTNAASAENTTAATSAENTTAATSAANTTAPSPQDHGMDQQQQQDLWIDFSTILLTFLFENDSDNREMADSSSTPSGNNNNNNNFLRRRILTRTTRTSATRRHLIIHADDDPPRIDRGILLALTGEHLMKELAQTFKGSVLGVQLSVTPVTTSPHTQPMDANNQYFSVSQAIRGKVRFSSSSSKQAPGGMRYSSAGVPPEEESSKNNNTTASSATMASNNFGTSPDMVQQVVEKSFEGNAMDQYFLKLKESNDPALQSVDIVYKGLPSDAMQNGSGGVAQPTTMLGQEDGQQGQTEEEPFFEWNAFWITMIAGGALGVATLCIGTFCVCHRWCMGPPIGMEELLSCKKSLDSTKTDGSITDREGEEDKEHKRHSQNGQEAHKNNEKRVLEDVLEENETASYDEGYQRSEITSVYSYIDGNNTLLDDCDNSYSIAPSLMYDRVNMPEDADLDDRSLQSRMWSVADGLFQDPTVEKLVIVGGSGSCVVGNFEDGGANNDVVIGGNGANNGTETGRVLIFSDADDDDLSMVSDGQGLENNNNNEGASGTLEVLGLTTEQQHKSLLQLGQEQILRGLLPFKGIVSPEQSDDSSTESEADRQPPHNASNATRKVSLGSLGVSVRVRKNKDSLLQNRAVIAALGESTSDDDNSLFMHPDQLGQGKNESVLALSAKDKLDASKKDEFRFGPLPRGGRVLTDTEKQHLQLGVKGEQFHDEEQESASFALPQNYSPSAVAEEKKDDTADGSGSKYIESMASF